MEEESWRSEECVDFVGLLQGVTTVSPIPHKAKPWEIRKKIVANNRISYSFG